jgi:protoporphyrinogen oxidase
MTLALRLSQQGHRVTVIEGAPATGGLAAPQSIGGYTWDRFYHVILLSDGSLRALLDELGLGAMLRWQTTRTGFYVDGVMHSMSNGIDFLRFPPLSLLDKARLAATILYASHLRDWRPLEAIPVTTWLRRLSGRRTFERIWLPLLQSKLGENYRVASAAFIWAIIARLYGARRTGLKREMFGYVDGGYDAILARFRERLAERGIETLCGRPAAAVMDTGGGAEVRFAGGDAAPFDRVVLTVPCGRIAALCPQLSEGERERLGRVVYMGIICPSLITRTPLAGFYVTNITDRWVPFTGVIEMTALVDRARFGGNSLVYLPRYTTQDDPYWARSDAEIEDEFLAALERMYPAFRREDVLAFQLSRVREVLAVSTLHYSDRVLPPVRTSLPNVFVVNSAQIAHGTLNVNETVALANAKAAELAPHMRPAPAMAGATSAGVSAPPA